jgi:predicted GNAT family acetyltransferase
VSEHLELYFRMLDGIFHEIGSAAPTHITVWHDQSDDLQTNLAGRIRLPAGELDSTLKEISHFFSARNRKTTIYTTPFCLPGSLKEHLEAEGFCPAYRDAWMYYRGGQKQPVPLKRSFAIETVGCPEEMEIFTTVFSQAYGGTDPSEPYGKAPVGWTEKLRSSFGRKAKGRQVDYYLLREQGEPASVLLTSVVDGVAGIYHVGTVPQKRGRGCASALTSHAVRRLLSAQVTQVFLQTEQGSANERLYAGLGFVTDWVGEGWSL